MIRGIVSVGLAADTTADTTSDWTPLSTGAALAVVAAVITLAVGFLAFASARRAVAQPSAPDQTRREDRYRLLTAVVGERVKSLSGVEPTWAPLRPQTYGLGSRIANLKAGWSFQDSWVTSLTAGTSAVIAFASSSDLFTALLGETPESELRIPAVAALAAAALIALALLVVKLLGPGSEDVTVAGLVLSTGLVIGAAVLNVITASVAAAALITTSVWVQTVDFAGFVVAALLVTYGARSLWTVVIGGVDEPVPALPADATHAWEATEPWQAAVIVARLRADYTTFMTDKEPGAPAPTLTPADAWDLSVDEVEVRREPVRSLP